ncbi:hypothetical protein BC829DRAFT_397138 [Chytridium lagenaria]|nr:hypothetical protein BC829DRAFT_397138 [Chytridium lagenaria]
MARIKCAVTGVPLDTLSVWNCRLCGTDTPATAPRSISCVVGALPDINASMLSLSSHVNPPNRRSTEVIWQLVSERSKRRRLGHPLTRSGKKPSPTGHPRSSRDSRRGQKSARLWRRMEETWRHEVSLKEERFWHRPRTVSRSPISSSSAAGPAISSL